MLPSCPEIPLQLMPTPSQLAANQANAQLSTGPRTPDGKNTSSLNALKTGLTGRTVLLPSDDLAAYEAHLARFAAEHQPATDSERALVQSLADTEWRLLRIPALEAGIYALGRLELASQFSFEENPAVRNALLDAKIFLTYGRQLNNLSLQENRLRNQRDRDLADLQQLQKERRSAQNADLLNAVKLYEEALANKSSFDPAAFGFEFSMDEIQHRLDQLKLVRGGRSHSIAAVLTRKSPKAA